MSVKRYILDGSTIHSLNDLYDQLSADLGFPTYFGRNLDALWDVLSTDIPGAIEIVWIKTSISKNYMGNDFDKIIKVLRELEEHRGDFRLMIEME